MESILDWRVLRESWGLSWALQEEEDFSVEIRGHSRQGKQGLVTVVRKHMWGKEGWETTWRIWDLKC